MCRAGRLRTLTKNLTGSSIDLRENGISVMIEKGISVIGENGISVMIENGISVIGWTRGKIGNSVMIENGISVIGCVVRGDCGP